MSLSLLLCILAILERPIRTCRIQSDGINKLQEVDKENFREMLLRSIQDNSDDIRKNTEVPHSSG